MKIDIEKIFKVVSSFGIATVAVLAGHKVTRLVAKHLNNFLESEFKFSDDDESEAE